MGSSWSRNVSFIVDIGPFIGPLILLFWTSGDVSSRFQSQSEQLYSDLPEVYVMYVPWGSPLLRHLPTSWRPVTVQKLFRGTKKDGSPKHRIFHNRSLLHSQITLEKLFSKYFWSSPVSVKIIIHTSSGLGLGCSCVPWPLGFYL